MVASLVQWNQIQDVKWESILIGNGASRAVWDLFAYASLYDAATDPNASTRLSPADEALFETLGTENFEQVLSVLLSAIPVMGALGIDAAPLTTRYESIKSALAAAVHRVHIPWPQIQESTLDAIGEELERYEYVFSTNYDLLVYWSMMYRNDLDEDDVFKDYFWTNSQDETTAFDVADSGVYGKPTRALFPHGALHLVRRVSGATHKLCYNDEATILERFGEPVLDDAVPLIVTEGDAQAKLASIQQSDYLSFALRELSERRGPLVIFGHSLSPSDEHLVEALYKPPKWRGPRTIAVSMLPQPAATLGQRQAHYRGLLQNCELIFFDASTHPLGDAALKHAADGPLGVTV